ncbi:lipocalin-like domain-containing protein [Terriglobus saanensis]|uniref:Lipocalin-like domain-containing protein n=1 Tax=Terriglobus saanensis (strain ATCC BAA-1853 / DSM 23119 / SP1PR4) TaxID=401053 RepID=E8V592_TERSS|nr:lipocalin-like domain-containing protein [Terriglobus saanensis]ADV84851.1 hypothetical protein AciPR4_4103 [Terriglobus saanensis SP1PR4]
MKTLSVVRILVCSLIVLACGGSTTKAQETLASRLVGTWRLVFVDNVLPDASRVHLYGENPQGILTFDASGHYALQILRADRPKFAAKDKSKGTPQENEAAVQGSNSHFGMYSVNEAEHTVTFSIEHAFFPNWEGTKQTRSFVLMGDEFRYLVPTPTTGGNVTGEVEWKRVSR